MVDRVDQEGYAGHMDSPTTKGVDAHLFEVAGGECLESLGCFFLGWVHRAALPSFPSEQTRVSGMLGQRRTRLCLVAAVAVRRSVRGPFVAPAVEHPTTLQSTDTDGGQFLG